ncbi:MAG: hypothetical protein FJW35_01415, partial [Acidobacteria bacterium]|nr:hypothetical protein [Acidobacteriota bacterium]
MTTMAFLIELVTESFGLVWRASWMASILIVMACSLRWLLDRRFPLHWRHLLWYAPIARLVLPVSIESPISIYNLFQPGSPREIRIEKTHAAPPLPAYRLGPEPAGFPDVSVTAGDNQNSNPQFMSHDQIPQKPHSERISTTAMLRSWTPFLAGVWFSGTLMLIGWAIWENLQVRRRMKSCSMVTDLRVLKILEECKQTLGVRKDLWIIQSDEIKTPALYGFSTPVLLLPDGFTGRFSESEIRLVIMHELLHQRRADIAINWLTALLQAIHWFNPLVWYAMSCYRADRELACDAGVVEHLGTLHATEYARTIVRLASGGQDFGGSSATPSLAGISVDGGILHRRIAAILRGSEVEPWSPRVWLTLLLIMLPACLTDAMTPGPAWGKGKDPDFVLKLVDNDSGKPVEGAEVRAGNYQIHTDSAGHGRIPLRADVLIAIRADGYVPSGIRIGDLDGCWSDACTFKLHRGVQIGGTLRDEAGSPIGDASVVVQTLGCEESDSHPLAALRTWSTVSRADGRWACSGLPGDFLDLRIRIRHPRFREETIHASLYSANPKGKGRFPGLARQDLISGKAVTVLQRGLTIAGMVLNWRGEAIAGAKVWLDSESGLRQPVSVIASNDGKFLFTNRSGDRAKFTIDAPGYTPKVQTVDLSHTADSLRFFLTRGFPLRGRVVDERGVGIPGAQVRVEAGDLHQMLKTDGLGRFSWDSAPALACLRAGAQGYDSSGVVHVAANGREHPIRLDRAAKTQIEGQVSDAGSDRPVPHYRVIAAWRQGGNPARFVMGFGRAGRFLVALDDPLEPGMCLYLKIEAPGYISREVTLAQVKERFLSVRLTLTQAAPVDGWTVTTGGLSVAGARVRVLERPVALTRDAVRDARFLAARDAITSSSSGSVRLALSAAYGQVVLAIHAGLGVGEVPVSEFLRSGRIELQPWGTVQGVIRIGRRQGTHELITLNPIPLAQAFPMPWTERIVEADAQGKFRFEHVPPGVYRLARLHRLDEAWARQAGQFLAIVVRPGVMTPVELGGRGSRLAGRVILAGVNGPIPWSRTRQSLDEADP